MLNKSLADFAEIAFEKAVKEPAFCEMLVDICIPLDNMLPEFFMDNKVFNFTRFLSDRCRKELQRSKGDIEFGFDYEWKCREIKQSKLGNINLTAKLYGLKLLEEGIVHSCIRKILYEYENPDEEETKALCVLMYTVGESVDKHGAKKQPTDMDMYFEEMSKLTKHPDLSSKLKKMLVHLIGLRKNKWQHKSHSLAMTIGVDVRTAQPFTLKVKSSDTVYNVKAMIKNQEGYLTCRQMLSFSCWDLEDHRTLAEYNVKNNSIIILFVD